MASTTNHQVFNLIILDESGSMTPVKHITITGFNEIVQTIRGAQQQYPEQQHRVSLVAFNGLGVRTILDNQPADTLQLLTEQSYRPDASTPLMDAIGKSVMRLELQTETLDDITVLVSILTDGHENASREFSSAAIRALVDRLSKKGWAFTYMGANHAVEQVANSLSIKSFLRFEHSNEGMEELFRKERKSRMNFYHKRHQGMSSEEAEKGYWDEE